MPCYHPLHGYESRVRTATGKRRWVSSASEGFVDRPLTIPCGRCVGCRLEYSRQWAVRCMHEASLHLENCFITLTYSDEFLPPWGSLDKSAYPKFMKRLRKAIHPRTVRYYHAGEYGSKNGRPHYHACLFGFDFPDKVFFTRRGEFDVWQSPLLHTLWPFGRSEIGSVTFESAAYVARYIMDKQKGKDAAKAYERVVVETGEVISLTPEYTTMSRRPGIGGAWISEYLPDVFPSDGVTVNGKLAKPPRFYDNAYELINPGGFQAVRRARRRARRPEDETTDRLEVREACVKAKLSLKPRE